MKITIVVGAFFPIPPILGGAVEKSWFVLGQEFARRGHEVVMISRVMPQFHRSEVLAGVKHLRVSGFDSPRSLLWLKTLDLIYSMAAKRKLPRAADIVVTNTFWLPILLRDSRRGKVYVHVARYPKGQMRFYATAGRLQAPSSAVAHAIESEAPHLKEKIRVIPYPSPQSTEVPSSITEREKVALFVGRIHPEKGVHLLVEAFSKLSDEVAAAWSLAIVGPTEESLGGGGKKYLAQLQQIATGSPRHKIVFFGPAFDSRALEQHFRGARLFVYPSLAEHGESFGLAPLEAMTHGCAVNVSDLECFADFIKDGETGFVFDHRTKHPVEALRQKLENVMVDAKSLARVAENGYRKSADYSLERVGDQFLHDFSSLLDQSNATGRTR